VKNVYCKDAEKPGPGRVRELLSLIKNVRVGLVGDLCLDVYWEADMRLSELSRETPHFPLPVVGERMSPGAAGNVAANMAALGAKVSLVSAVGDDWRGRELIRSLDGLGIGAEHILTLSDFVTNAYCKPIRKGISDTVYEDPRIDFANRIPLSGEAEEALLLRIGHMARECHLICVCDQMPFGLVTPRVREALGNLAKQGKTVIADSRSRITLFEGMILKPNEVECAHALGISGDWKEPEQYAGRARALALKNRSEVCLTAGALGAFYTDGKDVLRAPAAEVSGELDICGAGDTFLSAFASATAAGAGRAEAAALGCLASGVTVKKIGVTGTATPEEILGLV